MRRAVLLVVAFCALPSVSRANDALALHSADAQVLVRTDIDSALHLLDELATLSSSNRLALGLLRGGVSGAIGFKLSAFEAWKKRGIDPTSPISISVSFDSLEHERAYRRLVASSDWRRSSVGGPQFVRVRVAVPILDAPAAMKFVRQLPLGLTWAGDSASNKTERQYVSMRLHRKQLLIDLAVQLFRGAHDEPNTAAVRAALGKRRPSRPFPRKPIGAAALVTRSGFTAWMNASAVVAAGKMTSREQHVFEIVDRQLPRREGPRLVDERCLDLSHGSLALFRDVGFAAKAKPNGGGLETELVFGADAKALAATFARATHELDLHRRGGSGWISIWLADLAGLRRLPRTASFKTWPNALFLVRQCATYAGLSASMFGWPMMIGAFADDLAAIGPRGKLVVESFAGAAAVVAEWHSDPLQTVGALSATLGASLVETASELMGRVFANRSEEGSTTWWGRGRLRPFIGGATIGATVGGTKGKKWLLESSKRASPKWLTGDEIAAARFDGAGVSGLAAWEPAMSFLNGAREIRLRVFLRGDQLVFGAAIERQ